MTQRGVLTVAQSEHIRRIVRDLVERRGNQRDAARELDMSQATVSKILRGEDPGLEIVSRMATAMGISMWELLSPPILLDEVVARNPGRWCREAINVVRHMRGVEKFNEEMLVRLLNRADAITSAIVAEAEAASKKPRR